MIVSGTASELVYLARSGESACDRGRILALSLALPKQHAKGTELSERQVLLVSIGLLGVSRRLPDR